ncbi:hypothetical protein, conserved [Plasmodium gonderi]|uniref:WD repeat-containing protein WRAP73 n=1 Tax=Plasmodium gonderi TaxID=77519 RepID=A0A1Y1JF05_PLAGO|nr:hypothetical protein, conserved [Plasmodium gonderi]GAW80830.1 hypothetical protein, conserved [Plasmodium gonderi]
MKSSREIQCDECYFSKSGLFLLYTIKNQIFLMESESLKLRRIYINSYKIDSIEFSNDDIHFLALVKSHGYVCVYSFFTTEIVNKIQDPFHSYLSAFFLGQGSNICIHKYEMMCISVYEIKNTEKPLVIIENVKSKKKAYCLSAGNDILGCITEFNKHNKINLLCLQSYKIKTLITCVNFNPSAIFITKLNNILTYSNKHKSVHVYNSNGELLHVHNFASHLACINILSINEERNVISMGMQDGVVTLLSLDNLREIKKIILSDMLLMNEQMKIYKENTSTRNVLRGDLVHEINVLSGRKACFSFYSNVSEGVKEGEYKLKCEKEEITDMCLKIGITFLSFSLCGTYMSIIKSHNNVIRIYKTESYTCVAILQQKKKITSAQWDNILGKARLLICTNSPHLFVWLPHECTILEMPYDGFKCKEAKWNCDGMALLSKSEVLFLARKSARMAKYIRTVNI